MTLGVTVRPLVPEDVAVASDVTWAALSDLDRRHSRTTPERTPLLRARGQTRIAHLQRTDPDGAFVAEVDGAVVGCALALVRDGMWFLSLLMVDPEHQGKGVGRALLDAALTTATDRSWILSTDDPAALRRYRRAGFALDLTYTAKGTPRDVPAAPAVRLGSYAGDAGLVDEVALEVRGARVSPDLPWLQEAGFVLQVVPGRGYVVHRPGGAVVQLAAKDDDAAQQLLRAVLAQAEGEVEVDWLSLDQQWAVDVCLAAGLSLQAGASVCLRGQQAMAPYLPSGAIG